MNLQILHYLLAQALYLFKTTLLYNIIHLIRQIQLAMSDFKSINISKNTAWHAHLLAWYSSLNNVLHLLHGWMDSRFASGVRTRFLCSLSAILSRLFSSGVRFARTILISSLCAVLSLMCCLIVCFARRRVLLFLKVSLRWNIFSSVSLSAPHLQLSRFLFPSLPV